MWEVGLKRKRLEIRRNPAADSFLKGRRRVEGNCWKINSLHGMIRLPRMEERSQSDQIGQNKFTVLAGSCRRRLDELTPEKFIEQPWIKFPSWSHLTQASSDPQLIHLLTESRGMCSWKHPHGHYVAHVHYFVFLKKDNNSLHTVTLFWDDMQKFGWRAGSEETQWQG